MSMKYGIHWFRRDLRVAGNLALQKQFKSFDGNVLGFFCFDKKFLSRPDFSINRFQFFLETLIALKKELRLIGSDLLVLDVGPEQAFKMLFKDLKNHKISLPHQISFSRDYEPFATKRDHILTDFFQKNDINVLSERDHLLIEPHELSKDTGDGYQVYSPFSRKWLEIYQQDEIQKRVNLHKKGFTYLRKLEKGDVSKVFNMTWKDLLSNKLNYPDHLAIYANENRKLVDVKIPEAGSLAGFRQLQNFKKKIDSYKETRDFPNTKGTSRLSTFLKNGSLTTSQIMSYLDLKAYKKKEDGSNTYLSELIWREFYYHILARHPRVEKESFLVKYKNIKWENDKKKFKAWKTGATGFPIVDAGMRELNTTGWMHNRVRMIVASFLTKDLLIDWRWGEKYFMEKLLDGDLAPNNGGWQWAASTGCDPQPYFRIFNPWLQSKRFDPEGLYIKKFIPELNTLKAKELHNPIIGHHKYPEPIVDHSVQREMALVLYKNP